jgi:tripartite ATP-independent transporter DctM subunit
MLLILLVLFIVFLISGVPLAYTFCSSSVLATMLSGQVNPVLLIQKFFTSMDSFTFLAIPLFLLSGSIMNETGITKRIIAFANSLVGQFYGGIAQTTALSGMLMAGISGSSNADATAIGALMLPPLKDAGYDEGFRVSLVSACAVLGPIIPPSLLMIVYAGVSTTSISQLFLAGVIPGVGLGLLYMLYSYIYARRNNIPRTKFLGWKNVGTCFVNAIGAFIMPLIIIGGILLGVVTATEAGILAVIYGILYGIVTKSLDWKMLRKSLENTLVATVGSILVICFANLIGYIFTVANLPNMLMSFITGFTTNGGLTLVLISLLLIVMGMFIDANAIILMMVPVLTPLILKLGINPLLFAMVLILSVDTGGLTPPVGLVLYIVSGIEKVNINEPCRKIWAFVGIMFLMVVLIVLFPQIALWIPSAL